MNDPVIIRAAVRKALALRPRETMSEAMLKLAVERLLGMAPGDLPVPDFHGALEWNHFRQFVIYQWEDDAEANYWGLTEKGKSKEGVA